VERSASPRCTIVRLVESLTAAGTALVDSAPEFSRLPVAGWRCPYPHQREAWRLDCRGRIGTGSAFIRGPQKTYLAQLAMQAHAPQHGDCGANVGPHATVSLICSPQSPTHRRLWGRFA